MSRSIDIRTYPIARKWGETDAFCILTESVSTWSPIEKAWSYFKVAKGVGLDTVSRVQGPLNTDEIIRLASDFPDFRGRSFLSTIPFHCWRYDGRKLIRGQALLDIRCWDSEIYSDFGNAIEGNASITIDPANPYWIVLNPNSVTGGIEYNAKVEENLADLCELLKIVVTALQPRSAKLFVDFGWQLPFNSHCTYFADMSAVIDDLRLIDQVWNHGLPSYGETPPLRNYIDKKHEFAFSSLRTPEQRRVLWEGINQRFSTIKMQDVTLQAVAAALEVTAHDVHRINDGFFVSDHPHFLNSFVDQFYLEVLDSISLKGNQR